MTLRSLPGPGSQRGYLDLPDLNGECFSDDLIYGDRMYRSGDVGWIVPGGKIEYVGRMTADTQIKLHGQRIKSGEIESLLRTQASVLDTVVVLHGGAETSRTLVAYAVPSQLGLSHDGSVLSTSLDLMLRENLPPYSIPGIMFVKSLPLRESNKLDLNAFPGPALFKNTPGMSEFDGGRPLTQLQSRVSNALVEALSLPTDLAVGPDTTYTEMGGTSLLTAAVVKRLNKTFGCKIYWLSRHVLQTGATGFLGAHVLTEALKSASLTDVYAVWHCAAAVNFIAPYADVEENNIKGTVEILRFASLLCQKRLVYISTLAVFFGAADKRTCGRELSTSEWGNVIITGYA
ncbi:hypothetical protein B0T26DRAFT_672554 [Lasiosphaeria miniovina]|uniref:Uncharacterized protein n=1 Tax=Lasiosphaeria miniovina TaxID=1954250 RepID=A0AA40B5B0_9PEZI|nr:uncharacterized protein B0T26DRAFT_672554 [Lasiosphaeria miniovina]KAK0727951.1 hypothetical protein B0T26DRAFT_672554 [Lasiosphaeria miniovina]